MMEYDYDEDNERKKSLLIRLADGKPGLAARWGRYVGIRLSKNLGRRLARGRVRREAKESQKALVAAHESVLYAYRGAERLKLKHSMAVHRVSLFFLTANRDIAAIKVDLLTAKDWWLRKLLARNVALMMYELDLSKVAGKEFREAINYFGPSKYRRQRLMKELENVRKIQAELHEEFREIRNKTIAHRDADAMHQYRLIRNIDEVKVVTRAGAYFNAASPLISELTELTQIAGDTRHLMNQYIGKKIFRQRR
ncbi:hypothetical protein CWE09_11445 [Aliidiomarina minuta]|uniref:Uncharacterized protein n=1 Tax=Aliidiomarina minuta TaxID=880057 RepID=A0A432W4N0_9GAMM|nr:hypothetical protein [Aliidiomarina minuta]RUO24463.1 hypothetical protein CWE09_11445 [Aliidiomarina minuta]